MHTGVAQKWGRQIVGIDISLVIWLAGVRVEAETG